MGGSDGLVEFSLFFKFFLPKLNLPSKFIYQSNSEAQNYAGEQVACKGDVSERLIQLGVNVVEMVRFLRFKLIEKYVSLSVGQNKRQKYGKVRKWKYYNSHY